MGRGSQSEATRNCRLYFQNVYNQPVNNVLSWSGWCATIQASIHNRWHLSPDDKDKDVKNISLWSTKWSLLPFHLIFIISFTTTATSSTTLAPSVSMSDFQGIVLHDLHHQEFPSGRPTRLLTGFTTINSSDRTRTVSFMVGGIHTGIFDCNKWQ